VRQQRRHGCLSPLGQCGCQALTAHTGANQQVGPFIPRRGSDTTGPRPSDRHHRTD
jgi:hypothetical protein